MEIQIAFQNDEDAVSVTETLKVVALGGNLFRLEHSPLFAENVHFGDVVELAPGDGEAWRFVRVVESSGWQHWNGIFSSSLIRTELFQLWLESIMERGGFWEVAYGGAVFVSWPPDVPIDVEGELKEVMANR